MKGKVEIPNLSEEHDDMKDVDVDVSLTTKNPESDILKVGSFIHAFIHLVFKAIFFRQIV